MFARMELPAIIRAGEIGADGRLPPERELSTPWGIGRGALRRALESLEGEGLIWHRQGMGTFVGQAPDTAGRVAAAIVGEMAVGELMFARLQIEPARAAEAALHGKAEDLSRLQDFAQRPERAGDADSIELWDWSFHRQIARMSGNPALLAALAMLNECRVNTYWRALRASVRTPARLRVTHGQHAELSEAIGARDAEAARAAMALHLHSERRKLEAARPCHPAAAPDFDEEREEV
ncbi:FadR/GntR family transcriptional regulator [Falsigemmobacter faecalis]|nr:FCD domain-containing protein [Falsigemmobacter faecalis]